MAKGGVWEEADIPRATKKLEFIHSVSHIN